MTTYYLASDIPAAYRNPAKNVWLVPYIDTDTGLELIAVPDGWAYPLPSPLPTPPSLVTNKSTSQAALLAQLAANSPARQAIVTNRTYIGLASPTNAQVAAEVKALAQQNNVIIPALLRLARLALNQLDADA